MSQKYVSEYRGTMLYLSPFGNINIKDEPVTPSDDFGEHNGFYNFENNYESGMKKSLSMSDINKLRDSTNHTNVGNNHQPQPLSKTKFVSMAESIYHFQRDTPARFHTGSSNFYRPQKFQRNELTMPQSPMLRCKTRSRPIHILSQKEKEEKEIEDLKKFKLKANPVPKYVKEGSRNLPEVQRKPPTVPEPFQLTEVPKKPQSPVVEHKFKARPAPTHILEKPQIIPKPHAPKPIKMRSKSVDKDTKYCKTLISQTKERRPQTANQSCNNSVKVGPFSFFKRDEELRKLKEEKIKRQIEQERKQACSFKAQPVPAAIKKRIYSSSVSSCSAENKENHFKFEARPATVLYKEPYKPVLKESKLPALNPFDLNTEKRAVERKKFEDNLKMKQDQLEEMKRLEQLKEKEREHREIMSMRAKLVHHAKPIPLVQPFVPGKSNVPITVPETPKFVRRLKNKQ